MCVFRVCAHVSMFEFVFRMHVVLRYTFQVRNPDLVAVYFSGQESRVGCGIFSDECTCACVCVCVQWAG